MKPNHRDTLPGAATRASRFGLLSVAVGLGAVVFAAIIIRSKTASSQSSTPLRLADNVQLFAPPTPLKGDLSALKARLAEIEPLKRRAEARPSDIRTLAELGAASMDAGDYLTARAAFTSIKRDHLYANPLLLEALGSCLMSLAEFDKASDVFGEYVKRYPTDLTGYIELSSAYQSLGRRTESAGVLKAASKALLPTDVGALLKLSSVYDERFDSREAFRAASRALAAAPRDSGAVVSVAQLQYKLRHPAEARDLAIRALELSPQNALAHRLLGDLAANGPTSGAAATATAEDQYLRSLEIDPGDAKSLAALASLYLSQQRYRQAAYIALTWLRSQPNSGSARLLLSQAYQGFGNKAAARSQQAIAQRLLASQRTVEQLTAFRKQRPTDARVRLQLAQALRASGQWSAALQEAQAAVCLQPDNARIRAELKLIYRTAGLSISSPAQIVSPTNLSDALR